jgi:hypothetical protein
MTSLEPQMIAAPLRDDRPIGRHPGMGRQGSGGEGGFG